MAKLQRLDGPLHFIGIGGSGMSTLAELAKKQGFEVRGSDSKTSDTLAHLQNLGIEIEIGHGSQALGKAATVVYSSAIGDDNVELTDARKKGLRVLHRSEFLASLMTGKEAITVAGTHGKSTTTAMIAHVLDELGVDPTVASGAPISRYTSPARYGNGRYFVAEADESDGSFLRYAPTIAVITNIAPDHMEYFKTIEGLCGAFTEHLSNIVEDGYAVVGWDSPLSREVGRGYTKDRLTYGFLLGCDVRALDYKCADGQTTFTVIVERDLIKCRLQTIGKHNVQNALAALAVVRALGLDINAAAAALASFSGVSRRMTRIFDGPNLKIIDDYAHNPGKIEACLAGIRESWPEWQLQVIFQPHRYSRLETMYDEMLSALKAADVVHVLPVYTAGETTTNDFSPEALSRALVEKHGIDAIPCPDFAAAARSVRNRIEYPTVVLTLGAGDVWRAADLVKGGFDDLSGKEKEFGSQAAKT